MFKNIKSLQTIWYKRSRKINLCDQDHIIIVNILITITQIFKGFIILPKAMSHIYKRTNKENNKQTKQNKCKSHQFLIFMLSQRIIGHLLLEFLQTLNEVIKLPRIRRE